MIVRPLLAADLEHLVVLHEACWREAYTGLMPPDFIDDVFADHAQHVEKRREQLEAGRPTWVAEDDAGGLVGFSSAGPPRHADDDCDHELYALYVRAAHWRTGIGHLLHETAVGRRAAVLWVLEGNLRATTFYEHHGWAFDGSAEPGYAGRHLRMRRPAGAVAAPLNPGAR